jgi:hypothetical protein
LAGSCYLYATLMVVRQSAESLNYLKNLADPTRFERATFAFGGEMASGRSSPPLGHQLTLNIAARAIASVWSAMYRE